jgi:hypothetical protein
MGLSGLKRLTLTFFKLHFVIASDRNLALVVDCLVISLEVTFFGILKSVT